VFWTALALLVALLLQTALTQIAPGHARILDPFLIVLVYCGLTGGEMHGMLAGAAAGWTKILIGFAVGVASTRFHLVEAAARALVLFVATAADALIYAKLASVFDVASYDVTPAGILARAMVNALVGVAAYEVVERRHRIRMGVGRRA
jgi:hypothetical protein